MKKLISSIALLFTTAALCLAAPKIGEPAPDFTLTDIAGKAHSLADYKGKYVVLEWNNPDCPFVKKHYDSGNMQKLQAEAREKGAVWLTINSGAQGKQGAYSPEQLAQILKEKKSEPTAYLLDGEGKAGQLYEAKTTPHMFVIDPKGTLIYAGGIDNKPTPNSADIEGATNYVRVALDEAMAGKPVSTATSRPYGCSVKY
jgi:peroxiredoxin